MKGERGKRVEEDMAHLLGPETILALTWSGTDRNGDVIIVSDDEWRLRIGCGWILCLSGRRVVDLDRDYGIY